MDQELKALITTVSLQSSQISQASLRLGFLMGKPLTIINILLVNVSSVANGLLGIICCVCFKCMVKDASLNIQVLFRFRRSLND